MAKGRKKTARSRKPAKRPVRARALATATLVGIVQDATTRLPINHATVRIVGGANVGRKAFTNVFGLYALTNLDVGRHLIEASKGARFLEKDKRLVAGLQFLNFVL
jgi:hypothetical protein